MKANRTLIRDSELVGRVEIPVCDPCADAALACQAIA